MKQRPLKPISWFIAPQLFCQASWKRFVYLLQKLCISGEYLIYCAFIAEFPLLSDATWETAQLCCLGLTSGVVCACGFYSWARVLDLSVLKMELKNSDSDLDNRPDHDSLTSFKLIYTGRGKTKPKLLWLPYFPMLLIYFWNFLLPEISFLLCDATSRHYLIDQMTICALYTTDMIILSKVSS